MDIEILNKKEWIYISGCLCVCVISHKARVQENLWHLPSKHEPEIVMYVKLTEIQDLEGVEKRCPP